MQPEFRRSLASNATCQDSKSVRSEAEHEGEVPDDAFDLTTNPYISQVLDEPDLPPVMIEGTPEPLPSEPKTKKKSKRDKTQESQKEVKDQQYVSESDQMKREAAIRQGLKSYLSTCMRQNLVFKAFLILKQYHKDEKYVMTSEVYDVMLREAAAISNWKLIKEIIAMMQEKEVPFSHDSFMSCFICLGTRGKREKFLEPVAQNLVDKMDACGYTVDDLFKRCRFTGNQRDFAVKGIRFAIPDYEPSLRPIDIEYISPLVTKLNDRKVGETIDSPATGLVDNQM